jgi:hypothetical protein
MKVCEDFDGRQLHKFIERPMLRIFDEAIDIEGPRSDVDLGRSVSIEYGPLTGASLARWNAILALGVRADNDIGRVQIFGTRRITSLIKRIVDKSAEETHKWALDLGLWTWVFGFWTWVFFVLLFSNLRFGSEFDI